MRAGTHRIRERTCQRLPTWNDTQEPFRGAAGRTVSGALLLGPSPSRCDSLTGCSSSWLTLRLVIYCVLVRWVCVPSLYTIFWHLSSYALHLTLQRDHPTYVVPSLTLPSLADHALFPHTIKAMKTHIVRQSQLYITKLQRMQTAEEGWRAAAADITAEYQSCQAQMAELVVPAAPRIPGQPVPEIESDRLLFSAPAHAEVSIDSPLLQHLALSPPHTCAADYFLTPLLVCRKPIAMLFL